MSSSSLHPWTLNPKVAVQIQKRLRDRLVLSWDGRKVTTIAGVDVGFKDQKARAAIVVLSYPTLTPIESATAEKTIKFPYIPGLLTFREGPAILSAWEKLRSKPDLLLFDGQGIAHPRAMGIAAHVGLWFERPSIGVAKSRLFGHHEEPGPTRGDRTELEDERDPKSVIGAVLRTRTNVKPLYVSPGHLIDVPRAVEFALNCCARYRLPEPIRWAHKLASEETSPMQNSAQVRL